MAMREQKLIQIRPEIPSARILPDMNADEFFQNKTIRPILKLQNDLLIEVLKNYIRKNKGKFFELKSEARLIYISNSIQKDIKFRNSLKGIIIGQFTIEEYKTYIENSSALNKRMMNLIIKRLQDQVQLFEPNNSYQGKAS